MLGWRRRRERLVEEIEEHIELETAENIAAGMEPEEARRAARLRFGNTLAVTEQSHEAWGWVWLERLAQDLRYAVRGLRAAPGYTATLVGTLALGLGLVATMVAVVDSILLRPVALPDAGRLVQVYTADGAEGMTASQHALSYPAIAALREGAKGLEGIGGFNPMVQAVRAGDQIKVTPVVTVTPGLFAVMGFEPKMGRLIGAEDRTDQIAVVSEGFWRERMQGDRGVLGRVIEVAGRQRTVVGVLPAGARVAPGTGDEIVYLPIVLNAKNTDEFSIESAAGVARLRQGVTRQQALNEVESIFKHMPRKYGERERRIVLRPYQDLLVGEMQRPLLALLGGVAVLLLIACANAANLQIGRAANRMPEMQVRAALGASFGRLLQQLVTESVLVSLTGAALGAGLAYVTVEVVRRAYSDKYVRFDELAVHPKVLVVTAALAVLVGVAATIAPMLAILRGVKGEGAQFNARNVTRSSRLPGVLVALQVALTCVLLVASGLFVRTLRSLEAVPLGFDPRGVTTMVLMPVDRTVAPARARETQMEVLHALEALPGVESATMQSSIPFSSFNMSLNGTMEVEGRPYTKGDNAFFSLVSTNFTATSGIRVLAGRGFEAADESSAAMMVLVNEAFIKRYLGGRTVLGSQVHFHRDAGETDADLPYAGPMTVVGVVEDEVQGSQLGAEPHSMVYIDNLRLPMGAVLDQVFNMAAQYAVRSSLPQATLAPEIRGAVRRTAPGLAEMTLQPMQEAIENSLGQRRLALRLVAGFGVAALLLSAVGIYGVLAYAVTRRRREIGIRIALGSSRGQAAGLVLRQAATMVLLGLVPGVAAAWAAGYGLRSFLYGVQPLDAVTLGAVAVVLAVIAAIAASLPAVRAAKVDPMEALRAE